jgi:hypothetical protein
MFKPLASEVPDFIRAWEENKQRESLGKEFGVGDIGGVVKAGGQVKELSEVTRPVNTMNVANDLNNPGNITYAPNSAATKYASGWTEVTDVNGNKRKFLVFDDPAKGMAASVEDIMVKQKGDSNVIKPTESLERLIDVWVGVDGASTEARKNYKASVQDTLGVPLSTRFSTLDPYLIAMAFAKAEGFGGTMNFEKPTGNIQAGIQMQGLEPFKGFETTQKKEATSVAPNKVDDFQSLWDSL